jgi:hypothetical protein
MWEAVAVLVMLVVLWRRWHEDRGEDRGEMLPLRTAPSHTGPTKASFELRSAFRSRC